MKTVLPLKSSHWTAALIAASAACLLCGYEFIRSASNSLYKEAYGRENLPTVMALVPLGAIVGGLAVGWLAGLVGTNAMPYFAAGMTVPAALLSDMAYAKAGEPRPTVEEVARHDDLGLRQFRGTRLLVCLLLVIVATQV